MPSNAKIITGSKKTNSSSTVPVSVSVPGGQQPESFSNNTMDQSRRSSMSNVSERSSAAPHGESRRSSMDTTASANTAPPALTRSNVDRLLASYPFDDDEEKLCLTGW